MSSISREQWQLAVGLVTGKISDESFCDSFSTTVENVADFGLGLLRRASAERDADAVELGLLFGHRFGFTEGHLGLLLDLAGEDWHTQHENIADALARLRSPASVEVLYKLALARHSYLDYDEAFALGVKCIWALGSLQTEAAVARLDDLRSCGNKILEENAAEQLALMEREGQSQAIRDAARKALGAGE